MNNAIRDEIASHCRRLRLRRLTEHLDDIHEESHEAFLLELLRREVVHRDAARVERSIKAAGFYAMKSLEDRPSMRSHCPLRYRWNHSQTCGSLKTGTT
jgi:uncharacterized protein YcgL (UPF0745 family)